jgi:hypothetical protein
MPQGHSRHEVDFLRAGMGIVEAAVRSILYSGKNYTRDGVAGNSSRLALSEAT